MRNDIIIICKGCRKKIRYSGDIKGFIRKMLDKLEQLISINYKIVEKRIYKHWYSFDHILVNEAKMEVRWCSLCGIENNHWEDFICSQQQEGSKGG